jgi:hypothetical protein
MQLAVPNHEKQTGIEMQPGCNIARKRWISTLVNGGKRETPASCPWYPTAKARSPHFATKKGEKTQVGL